MLKHEIFSRRFATYNRNHGLFLFLVAIFSSIFGLISDFPIALYGLLGGLIFFIISLIYFSKFFTWNLGAKGEEIVIGELKKLSKDYIVLNDVRLPNIEGNIDHVVIGENGIFVIETKHHKGSIKYEDGIWTREKISLKGKSYLGDFNNPIKQVNRNAIKLREFIAEQKIFSEKFRPWINTVIVFTNPKVDLQIQGEIPTDAVKISKLCEAIRNKKTKIKIRKNEIDKLYEIMKTQLVATEDNLSVFKDISESSWFKNYLKYMKFGIIWGVFYAVVVTLIAQQLNFVDNFLFGILFNGAILFTLGKSIMDLLKMRINNDILRLSLAHFIGYLPLFLIISFNLNILEYPLEHLAELLVRFGLIILTIIIYRAFSWKIPS